MLDNINKTPTKLFTLVATSLLSIIVFPAPTSIATLSAFCSNKASTSGLHNNEVAEANLHNQSLNDRNQLNIGSQQSISDPCQTSYVMDDPIYIDYIDLLPIEGIDDEIYIDLLPIEGIDDEIYIDLLPIEGIDDEIYIDIPITTPNQAIA